MASGAPRTHELKYGLQRVDSSTEVAGEELISGQRSEDQETSLLGGRARAATSMSADELAAAQIIAEADGTAVPSLDQSLTLQVPIIQQNAVPGLDALATEEEKYRHDVSLRPDEPKLEDYDGVPVELFGSALLRGMGWKEGQAIGKNKKNALIRPIEYVPRPALLGLGAKPDELPATHSQKKKKYIKPGETREGSKREYKPIVTDDGRVRHYREVGAPEDDRLRESSSGLKRGDAIVVVLGKHRGRTGTVEDIRKRKGRDTELSVELDDSRERKIFFEDEVERRRGDSASRTSERAEHAFNKRKSRSTSPGGSKSDEGEDGLPKRTDADKGLTIYTEEPTWVHAHTRVRVISEAVGTLHYRKKCLVLDTPTPSSATIQTDRGEIIENVSQRHLETIVPSVGQKVLVVGRVGNSARRWYGHIGLILEKKRDTEQVVVEMEDGEVDKFSYDNVCEYVS
ncbi:hypothetical protein M427DRAFT_70193 [Gonapodya prolifera JEL478]|uniref:G-patch domain-containing protein n=1 Tax=Gonapodya prolifera (strain JEL478) TaxID=1344416 RepID=A0A139AFA1_GONPJ|nr:hypothetical protein M427DRAFT_70193 [Gonapodya prolifera JEL478]|eukprot:KXS15105.1 hypothetical protein M427DRAFT_70193 [Gonapodya prolifera JEL478]